MFMTLCEDHPYLALEHSPQKETPCPLSVTPRPPDPTPNNLYSLLCLPSLDLRVLDMSQKPISQYAPFVSGFFRSARCFQGLVVL